MRRVALKSRTPLKRTASLNPMSIKRIGELNHQVPIRIALCKRVGGTPVFGKHTYYINGKAYPVTMVQCWGGKCECGCTDPYYNSGFLEPHHKKFASHMGKFTLENIIMVIPAHHDRLQNNELHWSKHAKEGR